MKTIIISAIALGLVINTSSDAQTKKTIGILNMDRMNTDGTSESLGNMARIELEKTNQFEVLDKYEMKASLKTLNINPEECFGKSCLVAIGKTIKADKMLAGSVETYPKKISITFRLIDVASASVDKQQVLDFLVVPSEIGSMIEIGVKSILDLPIDSLQYKRLTKFSGFDNSISMPNVKRLNTSGPRMGYAVITGDNAKILARPKESGGFNANPYLFQFGYQFETEYLNAGRYQALFEFIPTITGLDQGMVIPSVTVLNGLRNNVNGWEIAMGPIFRITTMAKGKEVDGKFLLESEGATGTLVKQLDSRGNAELSTGVLFGLGKTFRSGKMNIPINAYVVPAKDHWQCGISFGFNTSK